MSGKASSPLNHTFTVQQYHRTLPTILQIVRNKREKDVVGAMIRAHEATEAGEDPIDREEDFDAIPGAEGDVSDFEHII
ncbi:hypothetical protein G7Y89_g9531 [Cudoniella acicularis]|uniref:Uncharacterized protein n=1 Tax=Cudoniella acicularis TaxID=354080 RepID=A0A8H4RGP3_9HELO|nr:hypothetical protein G7Y89_g9531 [Cudoniella acicularis]